MAKETKLIPAICSQCGGKLEVPEELEKAHCIYCGTIIIIDKPKMVTLDISYDKIKEYEDEKKYREFLKIEKRNIKNEIKDIEKVVLVEKEKIENWVFGNLILFMIYTFSYFLLFMFIINAKLHIIFFIITIICYIASILFWIKFGKKKLLYRENKIVKDYKIIIDKRKKSISDIEKYLRLPIIETLKRTYFTCPKCQVKTELSWNAQEITCIRCRDSFNVKI